MTTSKRLAERKIEKFEKNITRRGSAKKGYNYPIGHIVVGVFAFVVVGLYIFQTFRAATSGGTA